MRRSIGDLTEVRRHPSHDELGGFGGKASIRPPAETTFNIGIHFGWRRAVVLGKHPGAGKPRLEAMARVFSQQGPGGHVHGVPGVITSLYLWANGDDELTGQVLVL